MTDLIARPCECGTVVEAETTEAFGVAFLRHVRESHPDWAFPDFGVRSVGEALVRLTGSTQPLPELGRIETHPVTPDRIGDWLGFFDHDAFAGRPQSAHCYCLESHLPPRLEHAHLERPEQSGSAGVTSPGNRLWWRERRAAMIALFESRAAFGYLAYVDGKPAGWVNAASRLHQALYRRGEAQPPDAQVISVSCFNVAPPYRKHGLAGMLLDRVIADSAGRGARWIEGYPLKESTGAQFSNFRGPRTLFEQRGFAVAKVRERDTVVRRAAPGVA